MHWLPTRICLSGKRFGPIKYVIIVWFICYGYEFFFLWEWRTYLIRPTCFSM